MDCEPEIDYEIEDAWILGCDSLRQLKYKLRHEKVYGDFKKWRNEKKFALDENFLFAYYVRRREVLKVYGQNI